MNFKTADLCDEFGHEIQVTEPLLQDFGGKRTFGGRITTIDVFEDNVLVRKQLEQPGEGGVLVVDGGGSLLTALLGDQLAALAAKNGWAGVVIHGCIRDAEEVAQIPVGVKALATNPRRSRKQGRGTTNRPVHFGGITFRPGQYLYADRDGIIVAERDLLAAKTEAARTEAVGTEADPD